MTISAYLYGAGLKALQNKEIDWDSDTICVALCGTAYVPLQNTHDYFDDISDEITGVGYTAGGGTLTGGSAVHASGTTTLYADNITWGTMSGTAYRAVVYDKSGGTAPASQPLILYVNFGAEMISSGGNFTITWAETGIAEYAVELAS